MKRILLVFATREGQTKKVATRLSEHLEEAGLAVHLVDAADPTARQSADLESCDLLVIGASMHAGGLESEVIRFVEDNAAAMGSKPRSFFLVLLSAAARDPDLRDRWLSDARQKAEAQLAVDFEDTQMIAGALRYSKYPLPLKWLMRRIAATAGEGTDISKDCEYTDWDQVRQYAEHLATQV